MRKTFTPLLAGFCIAAVFGSLTSKASGQESIKIKVTNPTKDNWNTVPVVVPAIKGISYQAAKLEGQTNNFAVQNDDLDGDGYTDELVFLTSLNAGESKTFELNNEPVSGTAAQVAHTGMYTKTPQRRGFEGPGWESDLVAFRLYWDERNASDVFCKTTATLSLENLARNEVNYHRLTPWGMDVLKVKTAVGVGGFGAMIDGKVEKVSSATRSFVVRANGPYRAVCDLVYTDWKAAGRNLELTARMKICGGQDYVDCDLMTSATDGQPLPELVCGFVKHTSETQLIQDDKVAMVGRWGNQALGEGEKLMGGNLGMAVMTNAGRVARIAEDDVNHLLVLKPARSTRYRYLVDWYMDPEPAKSAQEFETLMRQTVSKRPIISFE